MIGLSGQSVKEAEVRLRPEKFSGDWWKLIPLQELAPGEYAIVIEGLSESDSVVVWDFGVNR